MNSEHTGDANENLRTTFSALADHGASGARRRFGSVRATSSGVPIPVFNRLFVFTPPSRDDLEAAVSWMADQEVPFWVTVTDPVVDAVEQVASDLPAELWLAQTDASEPGMVLASLSDIPDSETDLAIETVTDEEALAGFVDVSSAAFEIPTEVGQQLTPASVVDDDRMQLFIGHAEGQAVACGLLVQTGAVAGVYTIGVLEEFRRRGYGEAMTWAVLGAGRDRGCEVGVLQSSELGYPVYERMGFETIVQYHHFVLDPQTVERDASGTAITN